MAPKAGLRKVIQRGGFLNRDLLPALQRRRSEVVTFVFMPPMMPTAKCASHGRIAIFAHGENRSNLIRRGNLRLSRPMAYRCQRRKVWGGEAPAQPPAASRRVGGGVVGREGLGRADGAAGVGQPSLRCIDDTGFLRRGVSFGRLFQGKQENCRAKALPVPIHRDPRARTAEIFLPCDRQGTSDHRELGQSLRRARLSVRVLDILGRVFATKWNATSRSAGGVVRNRDAISPHDGVRHVRSSDQGLFGSLGKFVRTARNNLIALGPMPLVT